MSPTKILLTDDSKLESGSVKIQPDGPISV